MHELSIALSLLDTAEEQAARLGYPPISALRLRVGPLSGVVTKSLLSAYATARRGTPFERAELKIEQTRITGFCPGCDAARPVRSCQDHSCIECGSPIREILTGRELELTALEIQDDSPPD